MSTDQSHDIARPAGRQRTRQTAAVMVAAVEPIFVDLPTAARLFSLSEATFQRMVAAGVVHALIVSPAAGDLG